MGSSQNLQVKINIGAEINGFQQQLKRMQDSISKIHLPNNLSDGFTSIFYDIEKEIEKITQLTANNSIDIVDDKKIKTSMHNIENLYGNLIKKMNSQGMSTAMLEKDFKSLKKLKSAEEDYEKSLKAIASERSKLGNLEKAQGKLKGLEAEKQAQEDKIENLKKEYQLKQQITAKAKEAADKRLSEDYNGEMTAGFKRTKQQQEYNKAKEEELAVLEQIQTAEAENSRFSSSKYLKAVEDAKIKIQEIAAAYERFDQTKGLEQKTQALATLQAKLAASGADWDELGVDPTQIKSLDDLAKVYESLNRAASSHIAEELNKTGDAARKGQAAFDGAAEGIDNASHSLGGLVDRKQEVDQLKRRILDFFSIGNAVQLFQRSVRSAISTIKELDETMTEAAVVTDFSVGDMWNKLPEYSAEASKLGVSINDLYEATTLYYQQGLKGNEVMDVGIETMKMARIASMGAEDATKAMTAALRGFNMEVNEMNATRVNDVYSELAAITASDTSQIATAMEKTASIAKAANMEFETTAALLAQIIETTQEAPETAGTAMKTIIARFTEVKKLSEEGISVGKDGEGETVNINKIDEALQRVGISLQDFLNGSKGIDDIFLELSGKWDSLDLATQRYIATQAAGSRQQSRFLAMMSDHSRTMELVNAANNSAGASEEQFGKTLESLESKLKRLKDAWDQFTMGLANNNLLKGAVDSLTDIIELTNKLINKLSGGGGLLKSLVSVGLAAANFGIIRSGFNKTINMVGAAGKDAGSEFLSNFSKALTSKKGFKIPPIKPKFDFTSVGPNFKELKAKTQEVLQINAKLSNAQWLNEEPKKIKNLTEQFNKALTARKKIQAIGAEQSSALAGLVKENVLTETQIGLLTSKNAAKIAQAKIDKDDVALTAMCNAVKQKEVMIEKGGLLGLAESIGLRITGNATKVGEIGLTKISIKEKLKELAVTMAVNAELAIGLAIIGAVIFAIGALIYGIVSLVKWIKTLSAEARLEEAAKATDRAKEAAQKAKQAYDDLLTGNNRYNELQDTLNQLTVGTTEWNKALLESNQQVLDLLDKYPELAKYISSNDDGVLTIDDKGFEEVIEQRLEKSKIAMGAVGLSQAKEGEVQKDVITKNAKRQYIEAGGGYAQFDIARNVFNANPSTYLKEGGLEAFKQKLDELNFTYDENNLDGLIKSIQDYNIALGKQDEAISTSIQSMFSTQASTKMQESGDTGTYSKFFGEQYEGQATTKIETKKKELGYGEVGHSGLTKKLEDAGLSTKGNQEEEIKRYYAYLTDQTIQEVEDLKYSEEQLFEEVAKIELSGESADKMNKFFEKYGNERTKQLLDGLNNGGIDFAISDLGSKKNLSEEDVANFLGIDEKELDEYAKAMGKKSGEDLLKSITDETKKADKIFKDQFGEDANFAKGYLANLNDEEYSIAVNLLKTEKFENVEDFISRVQTEGIKIKVSTLTDNANNINIGADAISESGDLSGLNEEELSAFMGTLETLPSLYGQCATAAQEWASISTQGSLEQLNYLYDLQAAQLGIGDSAMAQENANAIAEAQKMQEEIGDVVAYRDAIQEVLNKKDELNNKELIAQLQIYGLDSVSAAETEVEALNEEINNSGWDINIKIPGAEEVLALTDSMIKRCDAMQSAGKQIGEGFTSSIDDVENLASTFPGVLENAEVAADGTVQLDKDIAKSAVQTAAKKEEADYEGTQRAIDNQIEKLEGEKIEKEAELNMLAASYNGEQNMTAEQAKWVSKNSDKLEKYLIDNKVEEGKAHAAVTALMNGDVKTYKDNVGKDFSDVNKTVGSAMQASGKTTSSYFRAMGVQAKAVLSGIKSAFKTAFKKDGISVKDAYIKAYRSAMEGAQGTQYEATIFDSEKGTFSNEGDYDKAGKTDKNKHDLRIEIESVQADLIDIDSQLSALKQKKEVLRLKHEFSQKQFQNIAAGKGGQGDKGSKDKGSKDESKYENKLDPSHNTLQEIHGIDRDLEGLEDTYDDLLESDTATLQDLANNLDEQEKELLSELGLDDKLISERKDQLNKILADNSDLRDYVWVEDGKVKVNQNLMDSLEGTSNEEGSTANRVQEYFEAVTDAIKNLEDAEDEKRDTQNQLDELRKRDYKKDFKDSRFENAYDYLYAVLQELEELAKEQEALENEYDALLKKRNVNASEIATNLAKQKDNLEKQQYYAKEAQFASRENIKNILADNSDLSQYAGYNWSTGRVEYNIEALNSITDTEEGAHVEEFIKLLEEANDKIDESDKTLLEIEGKLSEFEALGREEYLDLQHRVLEALLKIKENEINKLSAINDSINNTNKVLIDSIRDTIAQERQLRKNEKTEEELRNKEGRLAYLKQDTSGGNLLEIKKLEEELANSRESYTDTLIDQKISELEEQNEKAAQQRQSQIDLLKFQLDILEKQPNWEEIQNLIISSTSPLGGLLESSQLSEILKEAENWKGLSKVGKMDWLKELNTMIAVATGYRANSNQLEQLNEKDHGVNFSDLVGKSLSFTDKNGNQVEGIVDEQGNVSYEQGDYKYTYKDVFLDEDGKYKQISDNIEKGESARGKAKREQREREEREERERRAREEEEARKRKEAQEEADRKAREAREKEEQRKRDEAAKAEQEKHNIQVGGWVRVEEGARFTDGTKMSNSVRQRGFDRNHTGGFYVYQQKGNSFLIGNGGRSQSGNWTGWLDRQYLTKFKTGGLANFTGPAWLDGSKTHPEIILNAKDTENFIALKDVLGSILNNNGIAGQTSGDIYYDFHIKVDQISNDYDVDRMVEHLKDKIVEDATYRNVNAINFLR